MGDISKLGCLIGLYRVIACYDVDHFSAQLCFTKRSERNYVLLSKGHTAIS
jgi:hypothetical protein